MANEIHALRDLQPGRRARGPRSGSHRNRPGLSRAPRVQTSLYFRFVALPPAPRFSSCASPSHRVAWMHGEITPTVVWSARASCERRTSTMYAHDARRHPAFAPAAAGMRVRRNIAHSSQIGMHVLRTPGFTMSAARPAKPSTLAGSATEHQVSPAARRINRPDGRAD